MVATFVWPWKNDEELLEVRDLFYPAADLEECVKREKQQLAVNIVSQVTYATSSSIAINDQRSAQTGAYCTGSQYTLKHFSVSQS